MKSTDSDVQAARALMAGLAGDPHALQGLRDTIAACSAALRQEQPDLPPGDHCVCLFDLCHQLLARLPRQEQMEQRSTFACHYSMQACVRQVLGQCSVVGSGLQMLKQLLRRKTSKGQVAGYIQEQAVNHEAFYRLWQGSDKQVRT
jgi:hypothetical protein